MSITSKEEKLNWKASIDALSIKETEILFIWLKNNAEIKQKNGVTIYSVPIKAVN